MRSIKVARAYLVQAKARLDDAEEALLDGNHPYTVRLSQECVELSLKAVLKAVGIEYPKAHEVSDIFTDIAGRFPDWFKAEIAFLTESSKLLFKKREPSLYGDEGALLSPNEVMSEEDAVDAASRAERAYHVCEKLVSQIETTVGKTE